ncbi:MAG: isochorismatase family protein [Planctomycetia bacterium]|nr:isochorismatase family protein [Planctomycetia bacterium]
MRRLESSRLKRLLSFVVTATLLAGSLASAAENLSLTARYREKDASGKYVAKEKKLDWRPEKTAIVICDMWDLHHGKRAAERVVELAPRMNEVIAKAREQGVLIIHAPSSCMAPYENTPMRKRAKSAPTAADLPADIANWCRKIPAEEQGVYPIDQSDGGEDETKEEDAAWAKHLESLGRNPKAPWKSQCDLLTMDERDAVSDSGVEIWNLLAQRGIDNVILMGVHTNMCVLGRPFGLRQMAKNGKNVVLMRDMTDTMYNPARWPYVSHFAGTDLIVEHIERFVCPTVTSEQVLGGKPFRFKADVRQKVAVLVSEPEYQTDETLPHFAAETLMRMGLAPTVLVGDPKQHTLTGMAEAIEKADLVVLSIRRQALPEKDLAALRKYLAAGKPLVAIRTSSHAFDARGSGPAGGAEWPKFDPEILGGNYQGHHGTEQLPAITAAEGAADHPIVRGVALPFQSGGSLYKTSPLASSATALFMGKIEGQPAEPVAWTNMAGKSRVFYTSLGHAADFENPSFVTLLSNGVRWALDLRIPDPKEAPVLGKTP